MATYGVLVRAMRETDLQKAHRIMRLAFGDFLHLDDPMSFMRDADDVFAIDDSRSRGFKSQAPDQF